MTGGVRYQSNATAAPDQEIIDINGVPIRLEANARANSDGNAFALADVHFVYDLRNQYDVIEATVVSYNSLFFDIERLNLNLIEAQLGPSFGFGRFGIDGTRLGIYGIGGVTTLGNALYTTQYGLGGRLESRLGANALFSSRNEYRVLNYADSDNYPTVRRQTGGELATTNMLAVSVTPKILLQGTGQGRYVYGRDDDTTYGEFGGWARGTYYFYLPEFGPVANDAPWSVSAAAGGMLRRYVGPDPVVDPSSAERDNIYWVEAGLSAPLQKGFSSFLTGQLRRQESNYATRDYFNAIFTFGVSKRF